MEIIDINKYLRLNIFGFGVSAILQLVGYVTPGWVINTVPKTHWYRYAGVWYVLECENDNDNPCEAKLHAINENGYDSSRQLKIVTTLAFVACVIVLVFLIRMRKSTELAVMRMLPICAYLSLTSGILILQPAGTGLDFALTYDSAYSKFYLPYSAILSGIGGVLALMMSIFMLLFVYLNHPKTNEQHQLGYLHDLQEPPNNHFTVQKYNINN